MAEKQPSQQDYLDKLKWFEDNVDSAMPEVYITSHVLSNPVAAISHLTNMEPLAQKLVDKYFPGKTLEKHRIDRSQIDKAVNYAGGYDYGKREGVEPGFASRAADSYQIRQYRNEPDRREDAVYDALENQKGILDAVRDREAGKNITEEDILRAAYEFSKPTNYASGGHVEFNPDAVQSIIDDFEQGEYGLRHDAETEKGRGYLNELKRPDGKVMTEYSITVPVAGHDMDVPTLVPGLSIEEVKTLLNLPEHGKIPSSIILKAAEHAEKRVKEGKPVFATPAESEFGER